MAEPVKQGFITDYKCALTVPCTILYFDLNCCGAGSKNLCLCRIANGLDLGYPLKTLVIS